MSSLIQSLFEGRGHMMRAPYAKAPNHDADCNWHSQTLRLKVWCIEGRKPVAIEEKRRLGGGYNSLLQTSMPAELRGFDPAQETFDSAHRAFTTTFPRGFALEVVQVYSGPPDIVYKFRHWGFMEGPFRGHPPTGEMVEFYGMAMFQVDDDMKIVKVEFFYDRGELLGQLLKSATGMEKPEPDSIASCPFMAN